MRDHWFSTDTQLTLLYPKPIQSLARLHWTPLHIAKLASGFLASHYGARVLDIGSGVGKFCVAGAHFQRGVQFFGIEQRKHLVRHAETASSLLALPNVHFIHGNLTELDFAQFDNFYFFNSFYENINDTVKIDDDIPCTPQLYKFYNRTLYRKFDGMPAGTRVATYHVLERMPPGYCVVEDYIDIFLKFWVKIK
jgi:SAM-dependent methyltransferase